MKKPQTFDDLYPSRFLKAGNFNGKKVTLTLRDYEHEELVGENGEKRIKTIFHFAETPRSLVACRTNGECVKAMFGTDLKAWIGKRITFFPSTWNNEPCIRVWGSPDIEQDFDTTIRLPRRKPFDMRMHKVGAGNGAAKATPAPISDDGPTVFEGREPGEEG
jgi:hypothetical protein